MIARLGKEIGDEDSIYYWAWRNKIPVYSPALTDGSIGDMLFFHTYRNPGLVLDVVADIRAMNDEAIKAAPRKTGMLILGGGKPSGIDQAKWKQMKWHKKALRCVTPLVASREPSKLAEFTLCMSGARQKSHRGRSYRG